MHLLLIIHDVAHYFLHLVNSNHIINYIEPGIAIPIAIGTVIPIKKLSLIDYFDKPEQCEEIFASLIEKNLITAVTYNWIDHSKGSKAYLIVFIKQLHARGFLIKGIKMNENVIREICLNDFSINVSTSHIKHVKYTDIKIDCIPSFQFRLN